MTFHRVVNFLDSLFAPWRRQRRQRMQHKLQWTRRQRVIAQALRGLKGRAAKP